MPFSVESRSLSFGSEVKIDGEDVLIMRQEDILGILAGNGTGKGKK